MGKDRVTVLRQAKDGWPNSGGSAPMPAMPHLAIKLYPGRTEAQKRQLTAALSQSVQQVLQCEAKYISISFEEVAPELWLDQVYRPEILEHPERVYQQPGYHP